MRQQLNFPKFTKVSSFHKIDKSKVRMLFRTSEGPIWEGGVRWVRPFRKHKPCLLILSTYLCLSAARRRTCTWKQGPFYLFIYFILFYSILFIYLFYFILFYFIYLFIFISFYSILFIYLFYLILFYFFSRAPIPWASLMFIVSYPK